MGKENFNPNQNKTNPTANQGMGQSQQKNKNINTPQAGKGLPKDRQQNQWGGGTQAGTGKTGGTTGNLQDRDKGKL